MIRSTRILLTTIIILLLLGVIFVFDASVAEAFQQFGDKYYFAKQQIMWIGIGLSFLMFAAVFPLSLYKKFGGILFFCSLILLIMVLIPGIGTAVQGARRWIVLPYFRFQPSELMKIGIILYFPTWLIKHQKMLPFIFLLSFVFGLLLLEPDLGTALIVSAIAFGMYISAGGRWKYVCYIALGGMLGILAIIVVSPYRRERIRTYLNPEADPLGASYHIRQITIALGSGGWFGQGIGKSRQKYRYIPEASTDSIFAIAAEEVGFLGSLIVLFIFSIIIREGFSIAEQTEDEYLRLVAVGITMWIASQSIVNLGSITALLPLTGVPLPYFSYGGSSLVTILAGSGILVGIGRKQH